MWVFFFDFFQLPWLLWCDLSCPIPKERNRWMHLRRAALLKQTHDFLSNA